VAGAVATLRLCRPAVLNRLTAEDLVVLQNHCTTLNADPAVRVVVLTADTTGQPRPVFSAGYDVSGFNSEDHNPRLFEQTVEAMAHLRPVLVGGLNGSVYGGATDLLLACDLRLALPGLSFRMPACALGLHYYPTGLKRYTAAFGVERARQLFLTADTVTTERLHQWGVLMELVPPDQWSERLHALAQQVAALAPLATQGTKASLRELAMGLDDPVVLAARERLCAASADFAEGRLAMAERRTPCFQGV
jgi:enoyl-CoA hydratase/carnithine racemase